MNYCNLLTKVNPTKTKQSLGISLQVVSKMDLTRRVQFLGLVSRSNPKKSDQLKSDLHT